MSHPLEYHNFVISEINEIKPSNILDIGVGFGIWGYLMHVLREPKLLVGIDVNLNFLKSLKKHNIYDCLIYASTSYLPFQSRKFDYILAIEVIEHLKKTDAERMFEEVVRVCRNKIVVSTPNGYLEQNPRIMAESETHKSGWSVVELRRKGFKVRGIGFKGFSKFRKKGSLILYGFLNHFSVLLTFPFPDISEYLLAVKTIKNDPLPIKSKKN